MTTRKMFLCDNDVWIAGIHSIFPPPVDLEKMEGKLTLNKKIRLVEDFYFFSNKPKLTEPRKKNSGVALSQTGKTTVHDKNEYNRQ